MEYTFMDFETTGLDHSEDQIIEVGLVKSDLTSENICMTQYFVKLQKGRSLSDFIKGLTGITEEDLNGGVSLESAKKDIKAFIGNSIVVAQFASFDLGFIKEIDVPKFYCTRSMCKVIEPDQKASLVDICARFAIPLNRETGHRAGSDAIACMEVFKQYRRMLSGDNGLRMFMNKMVDSSERPLRYIPSNATVLKFG